MITFTRAPTVAAGDPITSTQLAELAAAFNDRLRSGLGDPTWRLHFYWLSLFRQVRNSDESGLLFPAQAEFFTAGYQMLDPAHAQWPAAGAGEPEGANIACQIMAYVFGAEALNLESEDLRLTEPLSGGIPLWLEGAAPETDLDFWELAKQQRGGYDPATGGMASPAWSAARSHYKLAMSPLSPHGNAYGGYLPTNDLAATPCPDPDGEGDQGPPPNYIVRFTALKEGLDDVVYPGTCWPVGEDLFPDHVRYVYYAPWAYYVLLNDGTIDVLKTTDYMEGPYAGEAALRKTANGAIPRMLNAFLREFRGDDIQRSEDGYWLQEAFDTQRFLTTQYHLAPQIGTESEGVITAVYPLFRFDGALQIAAGTLATHTQSSTTEHAYHADFVLTACMITATKLQAAVTLELLDDADVIQTVTITPDQAGDAAELMILATPITPDPLKVRLATAAQFTEAGGKIEVECTEILAGKPSYDDLFLLLRAGGALENEAMDGRGIDESQAREIGDTYFATGCIVNVHGSANLPGQTAEVNTNGVFDAARRLSQCIRMVPRQNFVGYAVENGKSILWFRRGAQIGANNVDLFAGIAPARDPIDSGDLQPERTYIVRTGEVTYNGTLYEADDTFTAVAGVATFTGEGTVYEYDGIRHTAEPGGWTNEWLVGTQLKAYHPSVSSIWKPDAYSDYWPLVNRCHFYAPDLAWNEPLKWHTSYGQAAPGPSGGVLFPESPSGYNYAPINPAWSTNFHSNVNLVDCDSEDEECKDWRRNFYRSCRVYEPDVEIESAVVEMDGETELVKLTFTGRFHHKSDAPASIPRDVAQWDVEALRAEAAEIRTIENALREYLVNQDDGTNATQTGAGNNGANSQIQSLPDNPYGSVYPHFLFTKLIPSPREDSNDTQQTTDTPVTHDQFTLMELYLRAMCEGYVDGQTTADYADCENLEGSLFDFTFENLCFQAFGNRWFTLLPTAIRPDNAQGFGPLPNTYCYADTFNQFSSAINLLTTVRVMLPMLLEIGFTYGGAETHVTATNADGTPNDDCGPGNAAIWWDGTPPDAQASGSPASWSQGIGMAAQVYPVLTGECDANGAWRILTTRQNAHARWRVSDPDAIWAIPDAWQDMLEENAALLARLTTTTQTMTRAIVPFEQSSECCLESEEGCQGWWHKGGADYWLFTPTDMDNTVECTVMPASLSAGAPLFTTLAFGRTPTTACSPGPVNTKAADPIITDAAMIQVPLV